MVTKIVKLAPGAVMSGTDKYASQRALNELDAKRASADWAGDTGVYPKFQIGDNDETVPALPALVRPQAE